MPLYEYACEKCGRRTERIEKMSGPHLKKCPHCGGRVERMISRTAIQFKGSGWYVTDYAKSGSAGDKKNAEGGGSDGGSEPAKSAEKTDAKPTEKAAPASKEKKKATSKEK